MIRINILRPLTEEEKKKSIAARKRANKILAETRARIKKSAYYGWQRDFEKLRDIKGLPVVIVQNGCRITLNYQLLYQLYKKLKYQNFVIKIQQLPFGSTVLSIDYWSTKSKGWIELKNLPDYQCEVLEDLPVIHID